MLEGIFPCNVCVCVCVQSASSDEMQLVRDSLNSVRRFLHNSKTQRDAIDALELSITSLMTRLVSAQSPSSSSLSSPDSSQYFHPRPSGPTPSHSTPSSRQPTHADVILSPSNGSTHTAVDQHTDSLHRNQRPAGAYVQYTQCIPAHFYELP